MSQCFENVVLGVRNRVVVTKVSLTDKVLIFLFLPVSSAFVSRKAIHPEK